MHKPIRKNVRVDWHDYGAGWYFITICSFEQQLVFGAIENCETRLSETGKVVESTWIETLNLRKDLREGCHVIMPNHFHALLGIDDIRNAQIKSSLPVVVSNFKAACSRKAKQISYTLPLWQRNYHEHIVRNAEEWDRIADYIYKNPEVWEQDRFYKSV